MGLHSFFVIYFIAGRRDITEDLSESACASYEAEERVNALAVVQEVLEMIDSGAEFVVKCLSLFGVRRAGDDEMVYGLYVMALLASGARDCAGVCSVEHDRYVAGRAARSDGEVDVATSLEKCFDGADGSRTSGGRSEPAC